MTILATVEMGRSSRSTEPAGWPRLGANRDRPVAHLAVGNPHTVVGVDDVASVDLLTLGGLVPDVNLEIIEPGPGRRRRDDARPRARRRDHRGLRHRRGGGRVGGLALGARQRHQELVVHMDGGSARVSLHRPAPGRSR